MKNILILFFLSGLPSFVYGFELIAGDTRVDGNFQDQETGLKFLKAGALGLTAYVKLSNNNYVVLMDTTLGGFSEDINYLGNYHLTPYTESIIMAGETPAAAEAIAAALGNDYTPNPNPLSQQTDPVILYSLYFKTYNTAYGCLQTSPLRYGDIEGDGKKELVLLLGNNFIIFSTTLNKVIFSATFQQSDELTEEDKESYDVEHDAETSPQYIAFSGMDHLLGYYHLYPAWRSFAKLFTSDFNNDGKFDIVVWRKLYQSRLNSDPVLGFSKTGDLYVHYSLINGEYKLQTTEQADIQTWLTDKQLTWQKGYPSQSECAGQENQLIPEMHDPLLNDPDVLK